MRGATYGDRALFGIRSHFNPRTPCGVRPSLSAGRPGRRYFNPRTPCGVRHYILVCPLIDQKNFNPRTPCGVRPDSSPVTSAPIKFQSTHPVRGATRCAYDLHAQRVISIHAPRAGCDTIFGGGTWEQIISIHAPRAGCDFIVPVDFMSFRISTHAPRAGCDVF